MAETAADVRNEFLALTIGMFNAALGANYLGQLVTASEGGLSMSVIANSLQSAPQFDQVYPPLQTAPEFATSLVANLLGEVTNTAAKIWAADWVIGMLAADVSKADVILSAVQVLATTSNPAYANAKLALANKVAVAEYYSFTKQKSNTDLADLQAVVIGVTSSAATVTTAKAKIDNIGLEILTLGPAASGIYSAVGFTALKHGVVAGDVEFAGVAAGTDLTITASPTRNTTYTLADSSGITDALALTLAGETPITTGSMTATGVETIAITTDDTAAIVTNITHVASLHGNTLQTITVTGDAGFELFATSTALTNFDASSMTNSGVGAIFTTGVLTAAATLTGSAGADTLDASDATKAVTLNGGSGADTLTVDNNQNNTINGGAGNDTIVVGSGSNTITAGDGNDIITVDGSAGLTTISVGAGKDIVFLTTPPSVAGLYTSVADMGAGDKLDFSSLTTNTSSITPLGARLTLGGAAAFPNYLDAATAGDADAAAVIKWFQLGGNTYIVIDNGNGADTSTYEDGIDSVTALIGLVDLSVATVVGDVVTLG
jgi:hypothetical protein